MTQDDHHIDNILLSGYTILQDERLRFFATVTVAAVSNLRNYSRRIIRRTGTNVCSFFSVLTLKFGTRDTEQQLAWITKGTAWSSRCCDDPIRISPKSNCYMCFFYLNYGQIGHVQCSKFVSEKGKFKVKLEHSGRHHKPGKNICAYIWSGTGNVTSCKCPRKVNHMLIETMRIRINMHTHTDFPNKMEERGWVKNVVDRIVKTWRLKEKNACSHTSTTGGIVLCFWPWLETAADICIIWCSLGGGALKLWDAARADQICMSVNQTVCVFDCLVLE